MVKALTSPGGVEAWHVESDVVPLIAVAFIFEGGSAQDPDGQAGRGADARAPARRGRGRLRFRCVPGASRRARHRAVVQRRQRCARRLAEDPGEACGRGFRAAAPRARRAALRPGCHRARARADHRGPAATSRTIPASWRRAASSRKASPAIPMAARPPARSRASRRSRATISSPCIGRSLPAAASRSPSSAPSAATTSPRCSTRCSARCRRPSRSRHRAGDACRSSASASSSISTCRNRSSASACNGIAWRDPDFIPAYVLNHILGGGAFTSRLFQEVREKRGLAYSVGTSLVSYRSAAMTWGYTATKNERVVEALDVIADEMAKLDERRPVRRRAAEGQGLPHRLLCARLRHLDQDRPHARADRLRGPRHRLYRPPQRPGRRRDPSRYPQRRRAHLRRRPDADGDRGTADGSVIVSGCDGRNASCTTGMSFSTLASVASLP